MDDGNTRKHPTFFVAGRPEATRHVRMPAAALRLSNAMTYAFPSHRLLHELFEDQVERTPDALAVVCEQRSLSYRELNERTNQLARWLRAHGVGADRLVGICVERGVEMVLAILAAWKAGGAYVPLDPDYPRDRLAYMLKDAAPQVLLIQGHLRAQLPEVAASTQILALDSEWTQFAEYAGNNLDVRALGVRSHHLAYVIYTSGSTGQPKGVMVEHRNVVSLWQGLEHLYRQSAACARIGVNASFNFDASVKQFIQVISGRTLVMVPQAVRSDVARLLAFINEHRIDGIDCTPSQLRAWIAAGLLERSGHPLRVVLVGGEAIDAQLWTHLANSTVTDFYNVYGPTESTVDTTFARLTGDGGAPHIGRPMENRRIYLLNDRDELAPIGASGEICIGGAGVARGYLNRPELTAARFIRDPFDDDPHSRIYKSGDIGQWRADGMLAYLGRNDAQVKIRGFRIELGEIEAQLARHPLIRDAVVLARKDIPDDPRLAAYLTCRDEALPRVEELREYLKVALPEHAIPSAFVILEKLPLSANGKVDRGALPAPDLRAYTSKPYEAPQSDIEMEVARVWQDLLRVERVGRHDSFLELGGHSLLLTQLLDRLQQRGWSISVRRALESRSLADFAGALTQSMEGDCPKVPPNLIPDRCTRITPQMLTLVELDATHIDTIAAAVPGGAANIEDIYPLSPLQEGILFHHLVDQRRGGSYVLMMLMTVSSSERLQALIAALQMAIDRHAVLRTAIFWDDLPQPVQVVHRSATLVVEKVSLEHGRDRNEQLARWLESARQRVDLRVAPLLRLQIAAYPSSPHWYALLQTHHLVSDNESLELLLAEVAAHMEGRGQELPPRALFRDHVAAARSVVGANDVEFFRSKLGTVEEPTIPFGLADVHGYGERIRESELTFNSELALQLRSQTRRTGVSAATLFHAAWALVIAAASGRDDVVFGTVLLGRMQTSRHVRTALGMFINTLPLRLQLQGMTSGDLVMHVHRELIDLMTREQASLAVAQQCSGIGGSTPLFSALMNYRHSRTGVPSKRVIAPGVRLLKLQDRTNYPVTLSVDDTGEGYVLTVKIDRDIDPGRILAQISTSMRSLLQALQHDPTIPALSLPVLPEEESRDILRLANIASAAYPAQRLLHELFEEQVERTPDALALICEHRSMSYRELNERANQLARWLRTQGVGADQLVGICVERSIEMVLAMLAAWKAGGAYVPLDPDYPRDRLAYMLQDANPRVLLIQEHLRAQLPETAGSTEILALDSGWAQISGYAGSNLDARTIGLRSRHLAYVIYTSGSTGQPKGVMVEHRNVVSLWQGLEHLYRQSVSCVRIAVNASFNFDASVKQFIQVLSGRTLVLVPQAVRSDAALLLAFIDEHRVDGIDCTPSQLRAWIAAGLLERSEHPLRVVLVGGEAIDPQLWQLLADSTVTDFYNVYGPTESTVDTTFARLQGDEGAPHIGRPMENRRVYLLNDRDELVPIGARGEICIGGAGVARGYLNRPELTAARFIRDPFSDDPHSRIYKSGDIGQWRADGMLDYLGRNDAQVKIRGFRIELGEIEAQLARHPLVDTAAIVARADTAGEQRLIAYVSPHCGRTPSIEALRLHLQGLLPAYMLPSTFVVLESLPLTPGGKINRRALAALEVTVDSHEHYESPQGELEHLLASMWQTLLDLNRVSRFDNFFHLGGHSLSAMQLIVRIRSSLGVDVPVALLFRFPMLSDLARQLDALIAEQLQEELSVGGAEMDDLLEELIAMPDSTAQELVKKWTAGGKR